MEKKREVNNASRASEKIKRGRRHEAWKRGEALVKGEASRLQLKKKRIRGGGETRLNNTSRRCDKDLEMTGACDTG